jgi:protein-S-isoprenylcysteine O-methyltransferase Ste14
MIITCENIILACWATFIIVWVLLSFNTKRDIRGGYSGVWRQFWLLRIVAAIALVFFAIRVARGMANYPSPGLIFSHQIFPQFPVLGWIAAALSLIGVAFAIWARVHLGSNWSPRPAVKEHHELVTSGPYAYVRHPIYTGVVLMAFATLLTGSMFGIGVFIIASFFYILRIHKEEKIMLNLFPNEYPAYQSRTKRLVPFLW